MADDHPNGFLKFTRNPIGYRDTAARVGDYSEIYAQDWDDAHLREQGTAAWIAACRPAWAVARSETLYPTSMT